MPKTAAAKILDDYRDPAEHVRRIYVEESIAELDYTKKILARAKHADVSIIADHTKDMPDLPNATGGDYVKDLTKGKHTLLLTQNRGRFFKPCPATREYRCCDYQVLNIGMNCPMDCVYCILQAYLNNPWLSFFVNIDDLFAELDTVFTDSPEAFFRIGTGEFTDSMVLDSLTCLSPLLVEYMRDKTHAVLELKTKTAAINNLLDLDHNGRSIVAWSVNSPIIMEREELKTAALDERLAAAALCADHGYRLAFHFDPIIYHQNWQQGYAATIERIFQGVDPDKIVWISLGALRFLPALKNIAVSRFPNSRFFHEEFVLGLDNKFRYFRSLRTEMYKFIADQISRRAASHTRVYLCMESDEIWQDVFGCLPAEHGGLPAMLDKAFQETM